MEVNPGRWTALGLAAAVGMGTSWVIRSLIDTGNGPDGSSSSFVALTIPENGAAPTAARSTGVDLSDPRLTLRELRRIGEQAALADPVTAVRAGAGIPGIHLREAYLSAVFTAWGERDGEEAVRWTSENLKGMQRSDALYFIADGWAEVDPGAAGAWFVENAQGVVRTDAVWEVLEAWGRRDPNSAATWAAGLEPSLRIEVIDGLTDGWAAVDPAAAAAFAATLEEGELEGGVLGTIARQWVSRDPAAVVEWAEGLLRESQVEEVYDEIASNWARLDPAAAAAWAGEQKDPGRGRWATAGVARGWAAHDPQGAVEWLIGSTPSDPDARMEMATEVMETWLDGDAVAVSDWLDRRESSPVTDVALSAFSIVVADIDPPAAMAWGAKISDEAARTAHLRQLGLAWIAAEGPGAIEEMKALDLPFPPDSLLGQ